MTSKTDPQGATGLDVLAALRELCRVLDTHPEAYRLDSGEMGGQYVKALIQAHAAIRAASPAEGTRKPPALDVDRLARCLENEIFLHLGEDPMPTADEAAEHIAAEYNRLAGEPYA